MGLPEKNLEAIWRRPYLWGGWVG